MDFASHLPTIPPSPLPYLHPLPSTRPLTPLPALLPPLIYYLALTLLPPLPHPSPLTRTLIPPLRNILALTASALFFRLPLTYHIPFSVGLTYQLALVGLYGGLRVLDALLISPYLYNHIPRRVTHHHAPLPPATNPSLKTKPNPNPTLHFLLPRPGNPVTETATTASGFPTTTPDRLLYALELLLSMRGAGFTWNSADIRHTKRTWRPSVGDRAHSIAVHVLPVLLVSWAVIRDVHVHYLSHHSTTSAALASRGGGGRGGVGTVQEGGFDDLSPGLQMVLTAALGAFLMAAFSLGHSLFAIGLAPLSPRALAFFPPLYSVRVWDVTSVRAFWSYGWHRLFSRLFLVFGVWPGEWLERRLRGKGKGERADVGKVVGGFAASAVVHGVAGWVVGGGGWGEGVFFLGCGGAVVVEEGVRRVVLDWRRAEKKGGGRWYDAWVGRVWWVGVLLYLGRNFARGWVRAGLVKEMAAV